MPFLLGLTGKEKSGKSTAAEALGLLATPVKVLAFADPMKSFCADIFGFTHAQLYGKEKELPDGRFTRPDGAALTPRYAMRTLGTEWGRNCDPDLWVKYAMRKVEAALGFGYNVVIEDVRFPNEAKAIREAGGSVWRIIRTEEPYSGNYHISEAQPPELISQCSKTFRNFGTRDEFLGQIQEAALGLID